MIRSAHHQVRGYRLEVIENPGKLQPTTCNLKPNFNAGEVL